MVQEKFLEYLTFEKRYSPHTLRSYELDMAQFAAFLHKNYELNDLLLAGSPMIRSWVLGCVSRPVKPLRSSALKKPA